MQKLIRRGPAGRRRTPVAADFAHPSDAPVAPTRRVSFRRTATRRGVAAASATLLLLAAAATSQAVVTVKNPGGLTAVGPVNTVSGFPSYYQDKNGVRAELCLDGDDPFCGFLPGDIP